MDNPAFEQPESPSAAELRPQPASVMERVDNLSSAVVDCCLSQVEVSTVIEKSRNYSDIEGVATECIDENDGDFVSLLMKDQIVTSEGNTDEHKTQQPNICSSCREKPETRSRKTQANLELHGVPPSWVVEANKKLDYIHDKLMNFKNAFQHRYAVEDPEDVASEETLNTNDLKWENTAIATLLLTNSNTADLGSRLELILKAVRKTRSEINLLPDFCRKQDDSKQLQELQSNSEANSASNTTQESPSVVQSVKSEADTDVYQKGDQALFEPLHFSEDKKIDMTTNQVKGLEIFHSVNAMNKGYQMRDFGTQTEGEGPYSKERHRYYDRMDSNSTHRYNETLSSRSDRYYNERESFVERKRLDLSTAVSSRGDRNFNFSRTTDASLKRGYLANPLKYDSYDFASANRYSLSYYTPWRRRAQTSRSRNNTRLSWRKRELTNLSSENDSFNFGSYNSSNQRTFIQRELLPKTGSNDLEHSTSVSETRGEDLDENSSQFERYFKTGNYGNSNFSVCDSSNQESTVGSELLPETRGSSKVTHPTKREISETESKKSYADAVAFKK